MRVELTDEQYHGDISRVSKSGLDKVRQSPAHYYDHYLRPKTPEELEALRIAKETEKPHFVFGKAFHCAILEPNTFDARFAIIKTPKEIGALNLADEYKAKAIELGIKPGSMAKGALKEAILQKDKNIIFYDDYLENSFIGKTALTKAQYDTSKRMQEKVWKHPGAATLLNKGRAESSFFFTEPETGAPCKVRTDFESEDTGFIVDLKSMLDASPEGFGKHAFNYSYHVQASFYMDGYCYSEGKRPNGFAFIAIEKSAPYEIGVYTVDPEENFSVYDLGRKQYLSDCAAYVAARQSGIWQGYGELARNLILPAYAFRKPTF